MFLDGLFIVVCVEDFPVLTVYYFFYIAHAAITPFHGIFIYDFDLVVTGETSIMER